MVSTYSWWILSRKILLVMNVMPIVANHAGRTVLVPIVCNVIVHHSIA